MKCYERAKTLTPAQIAFEEKNPTILKSCKTQGVETVRVIITKLLVDCSLKINVGKNLSLKQAWETSESIISDFNDWKVANVQQCLDRATAGRYGAIFDRLDCQVIMQWCSEYDLERMEDISRENEKKSGEMKGLVREPLKALELMKKEQIKDYVPKRDADSMQLFFNVKYELWERLCAKQPQNSGFRFLKRYGKMLSGSDYVEYKLQQKNRIEKLRNK